MVTGVTSFSLIKLGYLLRSVAKFMFGCSGAGYKIPEANMREGGREGHKPFQGTGSCSLGQAYLETNTVISIVQAPLIM